MKSTCHFLVDGALVPALDGRTETLLDPATEAPLGEAPVGSERDVDRAVEAASRALDGWAAAPPRDPFFCHETI